MTAIIVLNWNGAEDTIACLDSLYGMKGGAYTIVTVDNGSTDDSLQKIKNHLQAKAKDWIEIKDENYSSQKEITVQAVKQQKLIIYSNPENKGFAGGNNSAVNFLEEIVPNYFSHYLLLNNDTIVEPDFLSKLENFAGARPEYAVLTPQIRLARQPDRIWNCGGRLSFGFRKYLYEDKSVKEIDFPESIPISFITGCALFAKRELVFNENGKKCLLTERFFFGEEDFDFSLRMKEQGKKMACVPDSIIYHKVSASQKRIHSAGRTYIHYLNRFINIRRHWRFSLKFLVWERLYLPYVYGIFLKNGVSSKQARRYTALLHKECRRLDGVDRAKFLNPFNE